MLTNFCTYMQLAAEFQVRFEAPHVINARTQVWAGSIAAGPDKHSLTATFEHSKKPAFQVHWFFRQTLVQQADLHV